MMSKKLSALFWDQLIASVAILGLLFILSGSGYAQWKSFPVAYELNGKEKSTTISIPDPPNQQVAIRGVMEEKWAKGGKKQFAFDNGIALIAKADEDLRGFSKELLKAGAQATGHPELEYAGAIVEGTSKGGRVATIWAAKNRERTIAIILDHSFCYPGMPPMVPGVPMLFNATYGDLHQGHDRRKLHYKWVTTAYPRGQACTAIIDTNKAGNHGGIGTPALPAVWLREMINYRVPADIPIGKPYKLIDVNPAKVGGGVSAHLAMDGKRSHHTGVSVLGSGQGASWWMPGPETAKMYLEWVKANGGTVVKDESQKIAVP